MSHARTGRTLTACFRIVLCFVIAAAASAQQQPGRERGFKPEELYQFNGFDNVNLFSGNLNLTVPIGGNYPVAGGLSYSFVLRYSGNIWYDVSVGLPGIKGPGEEHERQMPLMENAGLGWSIGFGELYPPAAGSENTSLIGMWRYKSPDGGEHGFFDVFHEPKCPTSSSFPCETAHDGVGYTRDGTYLRVQNGLTAGDRVVEFGDGQRQLFRCPSPDKVCDLLYTYNVFSQLNAAGIPTTNWIKFDYVDPVWTITDSHNRTHRIHFQDTANPRATVVDRIVLESPGNTSVTYDLTYDNFSGAAGDDPRSNVSRPCAGQHTAGHGADVRFLTRVDFPNQESYVFNYNHPRILVGDIVQCDDTDTTGTLTNATLPTLGKLQWSYQNYPITNTYTSTGVKERIASDAANNKLQQMQYDASVVGQTTVTTLGPGASPGDEWVAKWKALNYFQADFPTNPTPSRYHGLPFTFAAQDDQGRYLSTVTFDCRLSTNCDSATRKTFVKYEMDWVLEGPNTCGGSMPCLRDRNRRVVSEGTTFLDDGGRYADTIYSVFDGLGHYRKADIGGTFATPGQRQTDRQTFTDFNPEVGTYTVVPDNIGPLPGFTMIPPATAWILGTYDFSETKEGTEYSKTETCFDRPTGFLQRTRILGNGQVRTNKDLLSVFTPNGAGFVAAEQHFGGDKGLQASIDIQTSVCTVGLPSHDEFSYGIDHTYQYGTLKTSQASGVDFLSVNNTGIDKSTGLVTESTDPAGHATGYTYDTSSRLKTVTPPGAGTLTAPTTYDYANAYKNGDTFVPARVDVTTTDSEHTDNSIRQHYQFDSLGRLWREKKEMPDGTTSFRETLYDFAGRRTSASEWETFISDTTPATHNTVILDYDAFGRAGTVRAPDGKETSFSYKGNRETTRTNTIATSIGHESSVSTVEEVDRLGRLIVVREDSTGANLRTEYAYRIGEQLSSVKLFDGSAFQPRSFTYDSRGLLMTEHHPEAGDPTYEYDARRHLRTKRIGTSVSLRFDYDKAERLTKVVDVLGTPRTLKVFTYDTAELPNGFDAVLQKGRLVQQDRNNYFDGSNTPYTVRDTFTFDAAGRPSKKYTSIIEPSGARTEFQHEFDYTQLGAPKNVHYPTCQACAIRGDLPIGLTYRAGMLTAINGVTAGTGITYTPAGQVNTVRHAAHTPSNQVIDGVLDTYTPDPSGLPRPARITFSNANDCHLINSQSNNLTVAENATTTLSVETALNVVVTWYEGVRGNTDQQVGTDHAFTTPSLTNTTYYWARVSSGSGCTEDSNTFVVSVCKPYRINSPDPFTGPAFTLEAGKSVSMVVDVTGTGAAYKWYKAETSMTGGVWSTPADYGQPVGTSPVYTFESTAADKDHTYGFWIEISGACGEAAQKRLIKVVSVEDPAATCATPVVFYSFPSELQTYPLQSVTLSVGILAIPDMGPFETHLRYRWNVNGKDVKSGIGASYATYTTRAQEPELVTVEIARVCDWEAATPVKFSPSIKLTTFVYDASNCPVPPLSVDQLVINDSSPNRKFTASSIWPSVTFEWFRGESGNTRESLGTGPVYTPPGVMAVWVRATSPCGTHADSPTLTLQTGSCSPVRFTKQPQSANVQAKVPYTIGIDVTSSPLPSLFTWYEGLDTLHPIGNTSSTRDLTVAPLKTTTYWVLAGNTCASSNSDYATLHVTSCADITIQQQPQTASINLHDTAQLELQVSSSFTLSHQWYEGETGDTSHPVAGQTLRTLLISPAQTTKYWIRSSITSGCEIDSPTVTVHVCRPPDIPQNLQTEYQSAAPGQLQKLGAYATGDGVTCQWYEGTVGNTSTPIGTNVVAPGRTTLYWFRATSACVGLPNAYADSRQIRVTVCPQITAQPGVPYPEVMPNTRANVSFNASIDLQTGDTIVWYRGASGDVSGGALTTMTPLSTPAGGPYTYQTPPITGASSFWALVTSGNCSRATESVSVDLCHQPIAYWGPGARTQIALNETQILSVAGSKHPESESSFTWYTGPVGNVAGSTVINGPGPSLAQFEVHPATTTNYWVRVSEPAGCYADTTQLTISVCIPTITAQPQSVMIDKITNPSATATLTVGASGEGIEYQWFIGQPGDFSNPVAPKSSSPSITVSPNADMTYWVYVTGCQSPKSSNAATVSLCQKPFINGPPGGKSSTAGANVSLTVGAIGTDLTYQWYVGTTGVTTNPVSGGTGATVTVAPAQTTDYWVRVSGRCGPSVDSVTAKVSIPPNITTQPVGGYVMPGTTRTLAVAATGSQLSYQWFSGTGTTINGATSASFTTPPVNADVTYWVRVSSGAIGIDSAQAVLTVCTKPTIAWSPGIKTQVAQNESQILSITGSMSGQYAVTHTWYSGNSGDVSGSTFVNGGGPSDVQYSITSTALVTKYWVRTQESNGCYSDTPTLTITICVPAITTQPQSILINPNTSTNLTVAANGGTLTYQWYTGDSGVTTNPISNATSATYTAAPSSTTKYWVRVTGSCGIYKDSNTATVTVCQAPAIAQHPVSTIANPNSPVNLTVYATGTNLTYQWYSGASGSGTAINNATSSTYAASTGVTADYWVKVSGTCGSVNSNTAKLSIAPAITTQPVGALVTKGSTKTLTVAASGTQLSYQWYSGASTVINGATSVSYTTPPINADTTYWARVWSGNASTDSAQAAFTVCQPRTIVIVTNPRISGSQITLRVDTVGQSESYSWYRGESGDTSSFVSSGYQLTDTPAGTTRYWVRTTRPECAADSPAVTVTVCNPAIGTQPQSAVITSGSQKTLTVAATGTGPLTYQWYTGNSGTTTNPISNATGTSYTTPALTSTTTYWVQVKSPNDASCSTNYTNSAAATVTVCSPPNITYQPQNGILTYSTQPATITVNATGQGLTYQWYEGASGVTTSPVSNATGNSVTLTPGSTKYYWVRVTGTCGTVNSNAALISVMPTIYSQPPSEMSVCKGTTQTFAVTAGGSMLSYAWYGSTNGGPTTLIGSTASITITVNASMDLYCIVSSGNAQKMTYPPTSVTVTPGPDIGLGIGKYQYNATMYRLYVTATDPYNVTYAWYKGAFGNTSMYISGSFDAYVQMSPSSSYWVRVTDNNTGCWTDATTTVP